MTTKELINELQVYSAEYSYLGYKELSNLFDITIDHLQELEQKIERAGPTCCGCKYQKFYYKKQEEDEIKNIVDNLEAYGYNPIHIIGNLYLVRVHSKRYVRGSFYLPKIITKPIDKYKKLW